MSGLGSLLTGGLVEAVGKVADDLITTEEERRAADLADKQEDNKLLLAQSDTNKIEAGHASLFVAGWRPFIGWVCGVALGLAYIPKAIVLAALWTYAAVRIVAAWTVGSPMPALPPYPELGVADLIALIFALLGMATIRSGEVHRGVARTQPLGPTKNAPGGAFAGSQEAG